MTRGMPKSQYYNVNNAIRRACKSIYYGETAAIAEACDHENADVEDVVNGVNTYIGLLIDAIGERFSIPDISPFVRRYEARATEQIIEVTRALPDLRAKVAALHEEWSRLQGEHVNLSVELTYLRKRVRQQTNERARLERAIAEHSQRMTDLSEQLVRATERDLAHM